MSFLAFTVACGNNNANETTTTTDSDKTTMDQPAAAAPETTTPDTSMGADRDFLMEAAKGGMMEVEAGKLAAANASSAEVKAFGKMMVEDHSKANAELKGVASQINATVPATLDADAQKHIDDMKKMKGKEFDKHYVDMMVDDHDKDVSKFEDESKNAKNDAVKAFAAKTLPVLQKHQERIKSIKASMKD